jgi:serine-type D-Ala-D-Ala carboxypeptidase/endopeptidase (penicillin-binding protein 4)
MRFSRVLAVILLLAAGAVGADRLIARPPVVAAPAALQDDGPAAGVAEGGTPTAPAGVEGSATGPAPTPVVSANMLRLRSELQQIVGRSNTGAQVAVLAVSLDRGDTLFSINPDVALAPASNMKLYSTAAALYYLGPDFRYATYVLGTGDVRGGVLEGDLILYGTGDPSMSGRMLSGALTPLRALADSLRAGGITEVRGDVVGDGSYFDAEWLGRGWSPDNFGAWYSAPVGALSVAENVASIRVTPGPSVGAPAVVATTPASIGFAVINRVTTVASGQSTMRVEYAPEGLVLNGRIARGHAGLARSAPIVDPTNFAAAVFRRVLEEQGVRVAGGLRVVNEAGESPVRFSPRAAANGDRDRHPRVLATYLSPTLADLVSVTNHVSHNLFAEALLKTVGRVALGEGTFDAGSRAIRYFLECEAGMDTTMLALVDGSGLSPLNRVSARQTIQLLDVMTRSEHWEAFHQSLPEAGRPRPRGLNRMLGTPAVGNLRAKTGTIRTVSSLSGYVRSADGERLAFSILANGLPASTWAAKRIEDEIGVRLAEFRRGEPVSATGPETPEPTETAAEPRPAPTPPSDPAPPVRGRNHTVRPGDSFDRIARQHGTTVAALERANPGVDPRRIQPGQTVRLPD